MDIKNITLYFKNAYKTLTGISVPRVVTYMTGQVILFIIANTNSTLVHFFLRKNYLFTLVCLKTSNMAWISCDHTVQLYWTIVFNLFLKLAIYFEIKNKNWLCHTSTDMGQNFSTHLQWLKNTQKSNTNFYTLWMKVLNNFNDIVRKR